MIAGGTQYLGGAMMKTTRAGGAEIQGKCCWNLKNNDSFIYMYLYIGVFASKELRSCVGYCAFSPKVYRRTDYEFMIAFLGI